MKAGLIEGSVIILEPGESYKILSEAGMKWNKRFKRMEAPVNLELLEKLSKIFPLPPAMDRELRRLQAKKSRLISEKLDEHPVPLVDIPVKADLYAHQVRGINMALITFEVV